MAKEVVVGVKAAREDGVVKGVEVAKVVAVGAEAEAVVEEVEQEEGEGVALADAELQRWLLSKSSKTAPNALK